MVPLNEEFLIALAGYYGWEHIDLRTTFVVSLLDCVMHSEKSIDIPG